MIGKGCQLATLSSDRVMLETMARKMLGDVRSTFEQSKTAVLLHVQPIPAGSY
jgi:hypothetical protein